MNLRHSSIAAALAVAVLVAALVGRYALWSAGPNAPSASGPAALATSSPVPPKEAEPTREIPSAPVVVATAAAPAPLPAVVPSVADAGESEMDTLRRLETSDPARALELARAANERDPYGPYAPERAKIVVKSLAKLHRYSEARGEAETMVNRYAGTKWALEVEQHTGAHPRVDKR